MNFLSPDTYIPVGSVLTIGLFVWWFAGKLNDLVSKPDFAKHVTEDEARFTATTEKMNSLAIAQAVGNSQLIGINARLDSIQSDVKEVLKK